MAKEKTMNESAFATLVRQKTAFGEMIRTRQDEKQSVMDEYRREVDRYKSGQLSRAALATSAKKVKQEITRLDREILKSIKGVRDVTKRASTLVDKQSPTKFEITLTGIRRRTATRKKTTTRKKSTARKATARKATRKTATRRKTTTRKTARKATTRRKR